MVELMPFCFCFAANLESTEGVDSADLKKKKKLNHRFHSCNMVYWETPGPSDFWLLHTHLHVLKAANSWVAAIEGSEAPSDLLSTCKARTDGTSNVTYYDKF